MYLNDLAQKWLQARGAFKLSSPYENNDAMQFTSAYLDEYKKKGIELHYELHYSDGNNDNHIRIDCHSFPYWEFNNTNDYLNELKKYYSEEQAEKIFNFRKTIKQAYLEYGKHTHQTELYYGERNNDNSLFLVKMRLPTICSEAELLSKVSFFIYLTYEQVINTLHKINKLH